MCLQNGMKENSSHPKLLQHVAWLRLLDSPYQVGMGGGGAASRGEWPRWVWRNGLD